MDIERIDAGDASQISTALRTTFTAMHGRAPVGIFAAPGRVNLIGEHVDYNGGRCLPLALSHATYAGLAAREDDTVSVRSLQQDEPWTGTLDALGPGDVEGWPAYVVGVIWALQQDGVSLRGMDIVVDSRVPVGAGVSSSAALECSVALGLCAVAGLKDDRELRQRLVKACMRAEAEVAGAPTGGMDQTIALFAENEHALLLDCLDWSTEQVPWSPAGAGLELLVVDTRASHTLSDGGYESRRRDCDRAAETLGVSLLGEVTDPATALERLDDETVRRRARHVFSEIARVDQCVDHLRNGDFTALGQTFTASHASMRDDFEISCPELDVVVSSALEHGALGARMTGGGFGGSAIALVPQERVAQVQQAVATAFADQGWPAPGFLMASGGAGARAIG